MVLPLHLDFSGKPYAVVLVKAAYSLLYCAWFLAQQSDYHLYECGNQLVGMQAVIRCSHHEIVHMHSNEYSAVHTLQ